MNSMTAGWVWVFPPVSIEWQSIIHRSLPPPRILGQKAKSNLIGEATGITNKKKGGKNTDSYCCTTIINAFTIINAPQHQPLDLNRMKTSETDRIATFCCVSNLSLRIDNDARYVTINSINNRDILFILQSQPCISCTILSLVDLPW